MPFDAKGDFISKGDEGVVAYRTRTHKGEREDLIGREGYVTGITPNGIIKFRTKSVTNPSKYNRAGDFYSEELMLWTNV
jgi:hypothetical protein